MKSYQHWRVKRKQYLSKALNTLKMFKVMESCLFTSPHKSLTRVSGILIAFIAPVERKAAVLLIAIAMNGGE